MSSCYETNTLSFLRPVRVQPAGAAQAPGLAPSQWLSWLAPQRAAYVKASNPMQAGESLAAYHARISALMSRITTHALMHRARPAGQADQPGFQPPSADLEADLARMLAGGDTSAADEYIKTLDSVQGGNGTGSKTGGTSAGMSEQTIRSIATSAAAVLGSTAEAITAILNSNNQVERDRIRADAAYHIRELELQYGASSSPAEQATIRQQQMDAARLYAAAAPHQESGINTNTMVLIGVGVVAVAGLAFFMMSRRGGMQRNPRNPTTYELAEPNRWNRKSHMAPKARVRNPRNPTIYEEAPPNARNRKSHMAPVKRVRRA